MKQLIQCIKHLLLMMLIFTSALVQAQISASYTFSASAGTYTAITGGTILGTAANDDNNFVDPAIPLGATGVLTGVGLPIGFTFVYAGVSYNKFAVNANGFIKLGNSPVTISTSYDAITSATLNDVIAGFNDDVESSPTGELSYIVLGTSPNRTLVVQWKDYGAFSFSTVIASYNFQIRLNETSNTIDIVYGAFTNVPTTDAQVGLKGSSLVDFNNRATTDWVVTTTGATADAVCDVDATIFPVNGQTFTYTPVNTPCVAFGGTNVTNLNSTSATLNWTSMPLATGGYNVEYRLTSTAPGGAFTLLVGSPFTGTTANITGLTLSTSYQWRVQSVCAGPVTSTFLPEFYQNTFTTLANCVAPTTLVSSGITFSDATLSWAGNLTATGYTLEYRQVGTTPYTSVAVAGTTTTITGLAAGTSYQWRVTSNCAGATPTAVSTQVTFTTLCNALALPFNESFEGITANNQIPACMAISNAIRCLTYATTPTGTLRNRVARSGTKFATFRYDTPATGDYFYTVPLQMTAGVTYQFSTWYITDGTTGWTNLDAWVGPNQTPTGLVAISGASTTAVVNTTYKELLGTFTVPTTGVYYVALRAVGPGLAPWYITFDDMFVGLPPLCIVPNGVTVPTRGTTTATVNWNAVAGSTGYNIQYRAVGAPTFTAFAGNPVLVGTSANLTGLNAITNYEVQVQNICTTTLSSVYSFSGNFTTLCTPVSVFPYEEGFEGISVDDELPNCMVKSSPTICLTYTAAQATFNRTPRTGSKFGAFRYGTATAGDYFYSAPLQLITGRTYKFSVWYTTDGASWGTLDAYVGSAQTPAGLVAIAGASVVAPSSLAYNELAGTFTVPSNGIYYVALRCATPSSTPDFLSFDDLSVSFPCANVVFAPATLPSGDLTSVYNQTIAITGGTAPYVYSVSDGVIPAGLTFNTSTGVISGTPTATSITPPSFTIKVTDATGCSSFKNYSITVTSIPCGTITVTPTSVPTGTIGTLYPPIIFAATGIAGATYSYSVVAGTLPAGMTLTSTGVNAGRLTGTPTTRPSAPITIRARIAVGPSAGCFGTVTVNLTINCSPMTLTPTIVSDAVVNVPYSQAFTATGGGTSGTFTYAVTAGTLPAGFSLSPAGILAGTSTVLSTPTSITITATRTNGCDISQTYTFGVVPTIAAPVQLNPIQISSSSFRVRWEPAARAVKYRIYVATSNNFDGGSFAVGYVGLAVVGDTSILVQNLKPETKYFIQITAISSANEVSPNSNLKDATTLSAITSIDNTLSSQVKVSPNPSKDKFLVDFGTLNLGKTTARVYDAQGKQIFSAETSVNASQTTIPLGNMASGIYLLEIISNKGRILKRLVKE